MKVYFEIKDDWIDYESPTAFVSVSIRQMAQQALTDAFIEQLIKKQKLPKIKVTTKEIKDRMITLLAEKALEQKECI